MDTAILSQPELDVFLEAEKLSSVPNGNFTQPYATKYAARQLYLSLLDKAKVTYESDPNLSLSRAVYGYLLFKIGQIHVETDESGVGEGKLLKAKELLEKISHLPTAICAYLATLNQLGCLNAEWGKAELAEKQLSEAERIYMEQKALESESAPLDGIRLGQKAAGKLETIDEETNKFLWIKFEEIHTFTLYFLAQVFKNKGDFSLAAKYCQSTLMRQLKGVYDPVDWSLNAAHLSQFYLGKNEDMANICDLHMARHCLAAAVCLIEKEAKRVSSERENISTSTSAEAEKVRDDLEERWEKTSRCRADVYRLFLKYGLTLLQCSKDRLLNVVDVDDILLQTESNPIDHSAAERFYISDMCDIENQICANLVSTFDQAREVFLKMQKYFKEARNYYTLNEHCRDHCELVQDSSKLYGLLAFFEADLDRKAKMQRKRVEMLNQLWKELNPTYYLQVCRQLLFEMGEVLNELVDIKRDRMEEFSHGETNVNQVMKVNSLIKEAIGKFDQFLQSHEDLEGKMPTKFQLDEIRAVVLAHLYIGRLTSKIITPEPSERLEFCQQSLAEYRWIVNYCTNVDPDCVGKVENEFEVCKDMCTLLPAKMDQIRELIV